MSTEHFIPDSNGENFITLQAGTNVYDFHGITGDAKEHYIALKFLDASNNNVDATGGSVLVQGSQFRNTSLGGAVFDSMTNGSFLAADLNTDGRVRPLADGPMRSVRLTLTDIVGPVKAVAQIVNF
jgi:hypothetical protein